MCGTFDVFSGWRLYMEDAHIATGLSDIKNQIFGIFDGHGGSFLERFRAIGLKIHSQKLFKGVIKE
jgi:serine/threonine protein phosphatase PrpC